MTTVPRTFCVTLRETPKRREEASKYFEQVGLKAEFFDGIHGESFGLKSTIPNYNILDGREYFITPGAVGCLLSHLTLWNILQHQPEDEFLIVEDDIQLCEGFFEQFAKFKLDLPIDWEIAYVGYILPKESMDVATHVNEPAVIVKPMCTHAYLVKKSALKILIETNQIAWNPLDMQIVERSLSKLKYYATKTPLITQRSVLNIKDETWYSLCYDWNINPEWLSTSKSTNTRLGNGWFPLEKNAEGYMIWTDGRGELIFDDKWAKMDIDFISEGEIDQKMKVICPSSPEQTFGITNGLNHLSIPINSSLSVVLVSDTFRPSDIYKTPDTRRLGIRLLKGITLTDFEGNSTLVSLYSMYGAKKTDEVNKISGIQPVKLKYNHEDGKINLRSQYSYNHHRSGLGYALSLLSEYHRDTATVMDTLVERTFGWEKKKNSLLRLLPYREPWVGIFHHPPNTPNWFGDNATPFAVIQSQEFQESLAVCKGLYTLSKYHTNFLRCFIKTVPIETLYFPTETPEVKFSMDKFIANSNKKVVNIGVWLRKLSSVYQLDTDAGVYQKVRLLPDMSWVSPHLVENVLSIEESFRQTPLTSDMQHLVIDLPHMTNDEYDELLSKNVVFLDLYDSSANNVIIECIARGTPILVNPLPAVVEYLGQDYPFYFSNLVDAAKKLKNLSLIKLTHEYLVNSGVAEKVTGEYFSKTIREGAIWKSL